MLVRRDFNEARYNSIFLLPKDGNPNYYVQLFRNVKNFFYGVKRPDLAEDLDFIIKKKIEEPMGTTIGNVLIVYKNLPYLNSFTRSRNITYQNMNIYKFTIQTWLDEIERWCFMTVSELEGEIRFTAPLKQWT